MKRTLLSQLIAWKQSKFRKPLVLQGARQVGKTYLLKQFGEENFKNVAYFNFEKDQNLGSLFDDKLEPELLVRKLSAYSEIKIEASNTLIIFDEIQNSDRALNSLKYFCEDAPQYYIASAGSLLGIKLKHQKSFPVGKVNFLKLYPLNFLEFVSAIGRELLLEHLISMKQSDSFDPIFNKELLELLKVYFFLGGMPEVIKCYLESMDLNQARDAQRDILNAYLLDFAKYAPSDEVIKITNIWQAIPKNLAKENKKFIFSAISKSARAREYELAIQWLLDAGLVYKCKNVCHLGIPLDAYSEANIFKIYLLDIGLLGCLVNLNAKTTLFGNEVFTEFKGAIAENFVAQELVAKSFNLHYWTSAGVAEVDFIVEAENKILPLEVKAGSSSKKRSLLEYAKKYPNSLLSRATTMNFKAEANLFNYPLYAVGLFPELTLHS
jgi:uncharacterized protein